MLVGRGLYAERGNNVCVDPQRLPCHTAIQVGGLLVQGATFDGTRLGPLAQAHAQSCSCTRPDIHTLVTSSCKYAGLPCFASCASHEPGPKEPAILQAMPPMGLAQRFTCMRSYMLTFKTTSSCKQGNANKRTHQPRKLCLPCAWIHPSPELCLPWAWLGCTMKPPCLTLTTSLRPCTQPRLAASHAPVLNPDELTWKAWYFTHTRPDAPNSQE
eukprot:972865-Pelagomonas_calceolata.AAC.6